MLFSRFVGGTCGGLLKRLDTTNMTTPLEEVRAKVIEAVPEIVKFRFGCRVELDGKKYTFCGIGRDSVRFFREELETGVDLVRSFEGGTIIGRPITLADVLRAIGSGSGYHLAIDGTFCTRHGSTEVQWNLALPLEEQSEEVISFLHKILCHD